MSNRIGGGGGGGGAFEDTDGDSVAELQDDHTDYLGGDARNIGAADMTRQYTESRYGTVLVWKADDGTVYADGPTGTINSGTNAATVINAAIDALPAAGGRVLLKEATYTLSAPVTITTSNVNLEGAGWGTILKAAGGLDDDVLRIGDDGTSEVKHVTVSDIAIDGNKANQAAGTGLSVTRRVFEPRVFNCNIHDTYSHGIELVSDGTYFCAWGVISSNRIAACDGAGVKFTGSKTRDHFISDNEIRNSGSHGIDASAFGQNWNHFYQNGLLSSGSRGLVIGGKYCNATGNHFEFQAQGGILVNDGRHCSISGNTFRENSKDSAGTYDEILMNGSYCTCVGNSGYSPNSNYSINKSAGDYDVHMVNSFEGAGHNDGGGSNTIQKDNI